MVVTTNKKSRFYFIDILKKFKNKVREFFRLVFLINIFKRQYTNYFKKGGHSEGFGNFNLLKSAFVKSKGNILKWAIDMQKTKTRYVNKKPSSNFFPLINEEIINKAILKLNNDGYYVMPWKMPGIWIDNAKLKAENLNVGSRSDPIDIQKPININPIYPTYWHNEKDVIEISEFKSLIDDNGIKEIIGRYLGCEPVFDLAAAWWTYPFKEPDSKSAQLYHYDLERIKWLKVFVYMNDVDINNGPHCFIKGSHNSIGNKISHEGRFTDEEVFKLYPNSNEVVHIGKAGTIIIEDTLGFHKGLPANCGYRFIFEFQYSVNGFGYPNHLDNLTY